MIGKYKNGRDFLLLKMPSGRNKRYSRPEYPVYWTDLVLEFKAYLVGFCIVLLIIMVGGGYRYQLYKALKNDIHQETLTSGKNMVNLAVEYIVSDNQRILNPLTLTTHDLAFKRTLLAKDQDNLCILLDTLASNIACDTILVLDSSGEEVMSVSIQPVQKGENRPDPDSSATSRKSIWWAIERKNDDDSMPVVMFFSPPVTPR